MKNLTAKLLTIGLLTLVPLSLEGQKYDLGPSSKQKYSYSLSKECRDHNKNVYSKSVMGKPVFLNKDARRYNKKVYANRISDGYKGISRQEKRYHEHLKK